MAQKLNAMTDFCYLVLLNVESRGTLNQNSTLGVGVKYTLKSSEFS